MTLIEWSRRLKYLAVLISLLCVFLIFVHAIYPQYSIDTTTIALIVILIFPWLLPYIKTLKLPGGTELTFRDEVRELERLSERSAISRIPIERIPPTRIPPSEPTRSALFRVDPNLALASLRIEIERKVREIARRRELRAEGVPLRQILNTLYSRKMIGSSESKALNLIIDVCNKAVHAEKVDMETAARILDIGESTLLYLDSIME